MTATSLQHQRIEGPGGGGRQSAAAPGNPNQNETSSSSNNMTGATAAHPGAQMSTGTVPNPFAAMPNSQPGMSSWGGAAAAPLHLAPHHPAAGMPILAKPSGNPVVLPAAAPPYAAHVPVVASAPRPAKSTSSTRARKTTKQEPEKKPASASVNPRRQKRLERNRESARLSRRRRKQYLEVLEERVTQLSEEMDRGRREHVKEAVTVLREKRHNAIEMGNLHALETNLVRTSAELRVASTFQTQQLQSLSLPPQTKFLLWLTLQTDTFFRGGRAASERLSAARIGERMLSGGTDRAAPSQGMWPLFCNEIGLSYDQEERARNFQKLLLQAPSSWLHRHTAAASSRVLNSTHDAIQALHHLIGHREQAVSSVLSDEQRLKLLHWAENNRDRLEHFSATRQAMRPQPAEEYSLSPNNHDAANLYIMNHRLEKVVQKMPKAPTLVPGPTLKRLMRRPSFESLGSSSSLVDRGRDEGRGLSREVSFSSSSSLKRAASELELDEDRPVQQSISPGDAEAAMQPTIDAALGFIQPILPKRQSPQPDTVTSSFKAPSPAQKMPPPNMAVPVPAPLPTQYLPVAEEQLMGAPLGVAPQPVYSDAAVADPEEDPSFLPPHLNAVPEETLLQAASGDGTDDFLFELTEEDWAIGEGLDMDMAG